MTTSTDFKVGRAWTRETPHSTGIITFDVIVREPDSTMLYIESIHETKEAADKQAQATEGATLNRLTLVVTH